MSAQRPSSCAELRRRQPERRRLWCPVAETDSKHGTAMDKTFHVLIVDDNPAIRQWLRQVLSRQFPLMPIDEAPDGDSALERVAAGNPDLVFMDIKLPGRNGLDVTRAIKSQQREVKVCVITSYDLPEYREAALNSGADCFFVKDALAEADIVAAVDGLLASFNPH